MLRRYINKYCHHHQWCCGINFLHSPARSVGYSKQVEASKFVIQETAISPAFQYLKWLHGSTKTTNPTSEQSTSAFLPLIAWEYFDRLSTRGAQVEQEQQAALASGNPTQFDVRWHQIYVRELELAKEMAPLLTQLKDAAEIYKSEEKEGGGNSSSEMKQMAREEIGMIKEKLLQEFVEPAYQALLLRLASVDFVGSTSNLWTMEVIGRAGGEEANLFARELFQMYLHYCQEQEWRVKEVTEAGGEGAEGFDDGKKSSRASTDCAGKLQIRGGGVYDLLRYEIGVHRVQRIPVTEKEGRLQTSTASVLLLPVPSPVSVDVRMEDCDLQMVRGSGPGGQGVNSSSNCAVLNHRPSGISVKCHATRSGLENQKIGLEMIAQKVWEEKFKKRKDQQDSIFGSQWTSGERPEKIRTYNQPQNRVTDHRLKRNFVYTAFLTGNSEGGIGEIHQVMRNQHVANTLSATLRKLIDQGFPVS